MKKKPVEIPADCMPRCATCAFYQDEDCRRYPPVVIVVEGTVGSCYPNMDAEDWCGEYRRAIH